MMPPAMGDLVWGMEPSADELNAELGGNTGKGMYTYIHTYPLLLCMTCRISRVCMRSLGAWF